MPAAGGCRRRPGEWLSGKRGIRREGQRRRRWADALEVGDENMKVLD
jgi:hypothetical protein